MTHEEVIVPRFEMEVWDQAAYEVAYANFIGPYVPRTQPSSPYEPEQIKALTDAYLSGGPVNNVDFMALGTMSEATLSYVKHGDFREFFYGEVFKAEFTAQLDNSGIVIDYIDGINAELETYDFSPFDFGMWGI